MGIKTYQNVTYHSQPLRMGLTTEAEDKGERMEIFTEDLGKGGWAISCYHFFQIGNITISTPIGAIISK